MVGGAISWAIVVPVKRLSLAKSRLAVGDLRADLALAMALDTVRAALACPTVDRVVAVTDEERAIHLLRRLGAQVVDDEPDAGLNPALRHGAQVAGVGGCGVAALSADLPALEPAGLDRLLEAAAEHPQAVVADWSGTGTTLYAARTAASFHPAYGAGSRSAHVAGGAVDLTDLASERVRHDVDTLADLRAVAALGCGPATVELLRQHPRLLLETGPVEHGH
jgi:2-phospho-L-lactate guanylyltransferase